MIRKQLLTLCLAIGIATPVIAAITAIRQNIIINGQTIEKTVAELTFNGDDVVLHFNDGTVLSADMSTVSIAFDTTTGLENIQTFSLKAPTSGNLTIKGLRDGQKIFVYDMSGRKITETNATAGTTNVDISNSKSGTYILRAGNNVIKFFKR